MKGAVSEENVQEDKGNLIKLKLAKGRARIYERNQQLGWCQDVSFALDSCQYLLD